MVQPLHGERRPPPPDREGRAAESHTAPAAHPITPTHQRSWLYGAVSGPPNAPPPQPFTIPYPNRLYDSKGCQHANQAARHALLKQPRVRRVA